jgi:hypothetical protein
MYFRDLKKSRITLLSYLESSIPGAFLLHGFFFKKCLAIRAESL